MYEAKAIAKLMEAIRAAAPMGRRPCSCTPRGTRRAARAAREHGRRRGKKLPAAPARGARLAARAPRRAPRGVHEHGRFPMGAAARIASMNFAIAFASYIKGNRGQLIFLTVMAGFYPFYVLRVFDFLPPNIGDSHIFKNRPHV